MAGESGQEKTEQPTDRRKKEARKKGTVAKSMDMISAVVFMSILMSAPTIIGMGFQGFKDGFRSSMTVANLEPTSANIGRATFAAIQPMLPALAMLMGVAMMVGLVGNYAQVGFNFSAEAMAPKFSKLNPANGLKRLFGKPALFDLAKSLVKLFLFSWMTYTAIRDNWLQIGMIWSLSPLGAFAVIGGIIRTILLRVGMVWLILAVGDFIFQKKQVNDQLKMTKEEVRQEMKDAETSPELKGARMRQARKLTRMRMTQAVQSADVIVTNPTHYAVALSYNQGKSHAPVVVAKGVDHLAFRIREIAKEAGVPIVENRPLARALHKQCEVGDFVPRELFQAVAEVLAYVYRMTKKVRK
ncbi:MAG: flagellar biosynthesis protein FlhB [Armatimonadetes bacterium]|nr:flagellar biosynthesis protein FlhB [Armatimonadota bacterium]